MAGENKPGTEEWRLGVEPSALTELDDLDDVSGVVRNHSAERLERPLCVLTFEHLGWVAVALWALVSRLVMLGARPLDSTEARHALGEIALLHSGTFAGFNPSWIRLAEAGIFAGLGAGDFAARLAYALSGLALIGAAFAMRHRLGRAGALGFAAILALSPSVTYFSRAGYAVVPALACGVLALAVFLELVRRPEPVGAAGLGVLIGLGLASGPPGLATAILMLVALAVVGAGQAIMGQRVLLQVRVWWTRRKELLLITLVIAAAIWMAFTSDFATRSPLGPIASAFRSNFTAVGQPGFVAGLDYYLPLLSLYEFLAVILAALGAIAVLTIRVRSRLAVGAMAWSAAAIAFYLWTPARSPAFVVQMIVPMALLGAFAIDYLHHSIGWNVIRYPLAALALLTLYVQAANTFVWYAPDASQAPWARSALLFWTEPTTSLQTPRECAHVLGELPKAGASAFFGDRSPVLRWYLRGLGPAGRASEASAIVGGVEPASISAADVQTRSNFELSTVWHPAWRALTPKIALRYLFESRAWAPVKAERVTIVVRPTLPMAPTVIFAPSAPHAASAAGASIPIATPHTASAASSSALSGMASNAASETPSASPQATPSPAAPAATAPSATSGAGAESEGAPTPAPSASASPSVTPNARPSPNPLD
jgi:uncharacterized protein (TIGR03663 family)